MFTLTVNPTHPTSTTCELWRIIGFMNNIDNGTGTKETRIKLIRNEAIGSYSWDTSASGVNYGNGINEWSQADAMKLLNPGYESESVGGSLYWNRGSSNATTACDCTSSGLKDTAKSMIGEAIWHTGAISRNMLTSTLYKLERSSNTGKGCSSGDFCNDEVSHTTTWKGMGGLMYSSDYSYATSGRNSFGSSCLNTSPSVWGGNDDCGKNDWLYRNGTSLWTLSPYSLSTSSSHVFQVYGGMYDYNSYFAVDLVPVLYLNANVKIVLGEGTEESPFILS